MLRIIPIILLLAGCTLHESKDKGRTDDLTEKEVTDFITRYDGAWGSRDTTLMKEIMDERYTYFSSRGSTTTRERIISWFTPADKYKVDTAARSEISITYLQGNTAVVSTRWIGSGTFAEERFRDDQRCGLVLEKKNGKVRIVAEHCTQIVP
jgi:hypothetical protein